MSARLTWENCSGILAQKAETTGWALCVGAGTSRGPFPDWETLVKSLMQKDSRIDNIQRSFGKLSKSFSLDTLIQAAKDVLKQDNDTFDDCLQKLLYSKLESDAGTSWSVVVKALTSVSPGQILRADWIAFLEFIEKRYPKLSALQIARVIVDIAKTPVEPSAILSFNAEPLLYAAIHACQVAKSEPSDELKKLRLLDRVTRGISHREHGRIPFIFCHGLMPIEGGMKLFPKLASPEKRIFLESEYIQLANSAFTWQSSLFLGTAVLRSMVFVGLSFSDPNLRRWLAWIHANRVDELTIRKKDTDVYGHYWIAEDPRDEVQQSWIEASVRHLGVRVVWIDNWERIGEYLNRMLGLRPNRSRKS